VRALRTILGMLWFSAMFFVAFPALVLWASGTPPLERLSTVGAGGIAVLALTAALLTLQTTHFVRAGQGTPIPLDPPRKLIATGPYRLCRNPIYVGYTLVILIEAAVLRSPMLAAYAAAFALLVHGYVVGVEEPTLRKRFGPAYAHYCEVVPRWLPTRRGADG
jgi:protein-S-isoprenylcysteine O-methyltransferase Ste14